MNITLETLTNNVSLAAQLMVKNLDEGNIEEAEKIADNIARNIYHFRKLSEALQVDEVK